MASLLHNSNNSNNSHNNSHTTNTHANRKNVSQSQNKPDPKQQENIIEFNPLCLRIADPLDSLRKELSKINFINITENEEKQTKDKYESIGLFTRTETTKQRSLWQLITVGRKNNYPQLLLLLSSDYSRQRIKYFIKNQQLLSLEKWVKKSKGCKQIISSPLNSNKHNLDQLIISAINTYQTRMCKPIRFGITNEEKINDSIAFFANHIINAIALIKNKNWKSKCQLDVWIIPQKIGENNLEQKNENNDSDSYDDGFDDDESDDEDDEYQNEEKYDLDKDIEIKNIEQHLKKTIGDENYVKHHNFDNLKREFIKKIKKDTQNKRFCMIVTRGNEDENVTKHGSMLYMYRASIMNIIPNDIPEWGIQAALTDILPSSKCNIFKQIKGNQCLGNKMFLLSLQKDQTNEIRAWLIMRNTICRFYPCDILNILPHFFMENRANKLTKKQYIQIKELISKHQIDDEIFDKFSNKKHNKEKIVSYDKLWRV